MGAVEQPHATPAPPRRIGRPRGGTHSVGYELRVRLLLIEYAFACVRPMSSQASFRLLWHLQNELQQKALPVGLAGSHYVLYTLRVGRIRANHVGSGFDSPHDDVR
jgi:hypothetical protein